MAAQGGSVRVPDSIRSCISDEALRRVQRWADGINRRGRRGWALSFELSDQLMQTARRDMSDNPDACSVEAQTFHVFRTIREMIAAFQVSRPPAEEEMASQDVETPVSVRSMANTECPACGELLEFNNINTKHARFPVILPCGHIECNGCAVRWRDSPMGGHTCMLCRAEHRAFLSRLAVDPDADPVLLVPVDNDDPSILITNYPGDCKACFQKYEKGARLKKGLSDHRALVGERGGTKNYVHEACWSARLSCALCEKEFSNGEVIRFKASEKCHFCESCFTRKRKTV